MNLVDLQQAVAQSSAHTFTSINFGCRVNSSEINQLSQILVDLGLSPDEQTPDVFLVNTCAITKKGEYESIHQIKKISADNPDSLIIATGCADLNKVKDIPRVLVLDNDAKDQVTRGYSPQIKDKFSNTQRYLLKVQSGCSVNCTFCIVPKRRSTLYHLPVSEAIDIVNQAVTNGYQEVIITGVNLGQYFPGLSNLVEALLTKTEIKLISFGSIPVLCIDDKFIKLLSTFHFRLSTNLHIPLQSGSDKVLKLMHRPYNRQKIISTFTSLRAIAKQSLTFSTDIIVGFPTETDTDFQETYDLCKSIGFRHIHTFIYSPRPDTAARELFLNSPKISKTELSRRSLQIRSLSDQ